MAIKPNPDQSKRLSVAAESVRQARRDVLEVYNLACTGKSSASADLLIDALLPDLDYLAKLDAKLSHYAESFGKSKKS